MRFINDESCLKTGYMVLDKNEEKLIAFSTRLEAKDYIIERDIVGARVKKMRQKRRRRVWSDYEIAMGMDN